MAEDRPADQEISLHGDGHGHQVAPGDKYLMIMFWSGDQHLMIIIMVWFNHLIRTIKKNNQEVQSSEEPRSRQEDMLVE